MDKSIHKPKNLVLDHYHCTLFLPLLGLEKTGFKPSNLYQHSYDPKLDLPLESGEAAGFYYFSPTSREILYDGSKANSTITAIKEWRLKTKDIKDWFLELDNSEAPEYSAIKTNQFAQITSVRLLQYFNGLYLLAVRLEPKALLTLKTKNKILEEEFSKANANNNEKFKSTFDKVKKNTLEEFKRIDPNNIKQYQQLIMENWMHFTRLVRLIYPSFEQQSGENKIAPIYLIRGEQKDTAFDKKFKKDGIKAFQEIGETFSPVMLEFIKAFVEDNNQKYIPEYLKKVEFYDDRMFVSVAYGIAGEQLPQNDLKRINTLVSYVDRQEEDGWDKLDSGYAYTPEIIGEKVKQQAYSLWEGLGGYYTFTDFSNSYLNRGKNYRTFIAPNHIPHIYDRMLIQALFYQASLRHYDNEICKSTKKLIDEKIGINEIKKQRGEFIQFTNQYWFHQLTEQMQGKDIFSLQQESLGVKEHYEILKDELERTDEYLQAEQEIKENKFNTNIGIYGFWFAFLALYYTILPILNSAFSSKTQSLWQLIGCRAGIINSDSAQIVGIVIMLLLLPAITMPLLYKLYKLFKKL